MGTHCFYIIWLPLRKRQYAVVLQWLGCGQDQGLKAKATTPKPQGQGHNPQGQGQGRHFVALGQGQGLTSLAVSTSELFIWNNETFLDIQNDMKSYVTIFLHIVPASQWWLCRLMLLLLLLGGPSRVQQCIDGRRSTLKDCNYSALHDGFQTRLLSPSWLFSVLAVSDWKSLRAGCTNAS